VCVHCAVAGGRSRLHLLDLGSCSRSKDGTALSLSALGTVLLALFNGQRHLPYRYSTLVINSTAKYGNYQSLSLQLLTVRGVLGRLHAIPASTRQGPIKCACGTPPSVHMGHDRDPASSEL